MAGPLADGPELLDHPAWRVLLRADGGLVDALVERGLGSAERDVDQPDHLVCQGDDGLLVRLACHEALELGGQSALGHARGVGAFAQDVTDVVVALPGSARLALACALLIARAQCEE